MYASSFLDDFPLSMIMQEDTSRIYGNDTRGKQQDDTGLDSANLLSKLRDFKRIKAYTMERHTEWHSFGCCPRRSAFLEPYGVRAAVGTRDRYIREAVPHPQRSKESLSNRCAKSHLDAQLGDPTRHGTSSLRL